MYLDALLTGDIWSTVPLAAGGLNNLRECDDEHEPAGSERDAAMEWGDRGFQASPDKTDFLLERTFPSLS